MTGVSFALVVTSGFYLYLRPGLPPVEQLADIKLQTPLRVFTADNRLIAEFGEKRRTPVTIEQIPELQIQAFLAAEDARFYQHTGVDIKGLARAATELVSTGEIRSGGSTITMQVAKNYFLSRDRTFIRKFNEILLAFQIERELEKDEILELYLNKIFLGNRAYGIAAAARVYYGKEMEDLTLAQMAMLAGLPKAPSAYNPIANPQRALARRDWILGRMYELGYITEQDLQEARAAGVTASVHAPAREVDADYVAEMARQEMVNRFGEAAYTDGFSVYLTIDSHKQTAATEALRNGLEAYDRRHGYRGPLAQLPAESLAPERLQRELSNFSRLERLTPAAVTALHEEHADVFVRDHGPAVMPLESMRWARRYQTENSRGPTPSSPADVLSLGDVVYVKLELPTLPDTDASEGDELTPQPLTATLAQAPAVQGALISLSADTGAIEALAGGYSFRQTKYNRATQARRQPGSTFKPFLYLAALEKGLNASTLVNDAPIVFDDQELEAAWRPQNVTGQFYGPTSLREALYRSRNLVSIRLLRDIGINYTVGYLRNLGMDTSAIPRDLSIALGSAIMTPMDLAAAFATIANGGYAVQPYLVHSIRDARNEVIYQAPAVALCDSHCQQRAEEIPLSSWGEPMLKLAPRVADERSVYIMHSMLKDAINRGTGGRAAVMRRSDIAGKTGTTNEQRDTWFAGFNHDIATTTWVGFDQPAPLGRNEFGSSTALPIWIEYMRAALDGAAESNMPRPNGIVNVRIDPRTGERAQADQAGAIFELFRTEDAPAERSTNGRSNASDSNDSLTQDIF
ncbi:MAG: penicillin-binding protein 1A [Marinobacter sp.]|nr:penicillin-binding protein 1A [Marinobacter sp.]